MLEKIIRLILFLMVLTGIVSCLHTRKAESQQKINPIFPVSGATTVFLQQYEQLIKNTPEKDYQERFARLIQSYGLKKLSDNTSYALCGFIRTDSLFEPDYLKQYGISFAPPIGDIRTGCIPLSQLSFFFSQPHILYFETSMPVFPLNK